MLSYHTSGACMSYAIADDTRFSARNILTRQYLFGGLTPTTTKNRE